MKLVSKTNEPLAEVKLTGGKNAPLKAHLEMADLSVDSPGVETAIQKVDSCLKVGIRAPEMVHFKVLLEPNDIKALKGLMNKDLIKFMLKAMFSNNADADVFRAGHLRDRPGFLFCCDRNMRWGHLPAIVN